jgi:hypothetical protein
MHPGAAQTHVHLGRILLAKGDFAKAKRAYLDALSEDPFDPETQVALVAVGEQLKDETLKDRGMMGATTLLGLSPKQVSLVASRMIGTKKDLSQAPAMDDQGK